MKIIYISFIVLISIQSYCQKQTLKVDSSKKGVSSLKLKDTFIVSTTDTLKLSLQSDKQLAIIFIKEDTNQSNDLLKYIIPVFTLLLGIGVNKILDYLKDKKTTKQQGKRWIAEIRNLETPIKEQTRILKELLKEEEKEEYNISALEIVASLDCEIFKSLDKGELLKYIQLNDNLSYSKAVALSNQIHGSISILTHLHEQLTKKFNEYLNGISLYTSTVNRNLQLLSQAFGTYGAILEARAGEGNEIQDPHFNAILSLFDKYIEPNRQDGVYDLFKLQKEFFYPIAQVLAYLRLDNDIIPMSTATAECLNAIKGIRMEKRYWQKNIETIIKRYEEQIIELKSIVSQIDNQSDKKV